MVQKILFINPFGIGDVLFTTPLVKAIKENNPENFLGYWCNERVKPILETNPHIDKIFSLSRGDLKKIFKRSKLEGISKSFSLLKELKSCKFDLAFDLSLDHRYSLILKFLGVRERIGYNFKNRGRFLTKKIDIEGYKDKHITEYYLELLKFLGIAPKEKKIELNLEEKDISWAKEFLNSKGIRDDALIIGICPAGGGSWGKQSWIKHWDKKKFAEVSDRLIERYNAKVIIFGDILEREICQKVKNLMRNTSIEISGRNNLRQFVALLGRCKILITNDGGPFHIARALNTKTVSIFGPVDEKVYGPYPKTKDHIVIKKDLNCRPCYKKFRIPTCPYNRKCLNSISVEEVFQAVENLLKN